MAEVRNAQAEATAVLGSGFYARVLEPSPPAVTDETFADDPVNTAGSGTVVSPVGNADVVWSDLVGERADLADFAAERWLGGYRRLPALPDNYVAAKDDFHRLAFGVVAEARRVANGKFGLRYTKGGYGTPFFGDDTQVRVEGDQLVVQRGDSVDATTITTLRSAGEFVGVEPGTESAEHDSPELGDLDRKLDVSAAVGDFLGEWYGFATSVLEELRATPGAIDPERIQVWPGHFDPALAIGEADGGSRATYGASPGDGTSDEPYLYVGPWGEQDASLDYWNAEGFTGAVLRYNDLVGSDDPRQVALAFYRTGYDIVTG